MNRKRLLDRLWEKLNWKPLNVFLKHYRSSEMDLSAIAVAYYLLLTAFPLLVIAANLFPYLNLDITDMLKVMKEYLPSQLYSTLSGVASNIFSRPSGSLLGIATVTALWTMSKSLSSLQKAINKAYGVSEHRDFVISHLIGVVTSVLILFLLTFVVMASTFTKAILQVLVTHYQLSDDLSNLILNLTQPLTGLVIFLGIAMLYFILPNVKIKRLRYILPGTVLTSVVWLFFNSLISSYVIRTFGRLVDVKTFGSIMIFVIMIWFIFLANILIFGAILNATVQELKQGELEGRKGDVMTFIQGLSSDDDK
ncbi:YihY/virulence factor BrkB family protein [Streptococcus loxodontisalivarius]|uniref:Membrane protein n=1 Tax=Streptococcus loxodontisalivarius TaxID=1349415 RepID=A0ABS2PTW8_9STRE|nr:YihY/virulence factor BrkB family protein [Streptococcus loxodontisalivarius]MBM7643497.1 membrane protein [Streptococcus loxodontisalivarius]